MAKKGKSSKRQKSADVELIQAAYTGPLPPANQLEKYEQIYPGAAEIILSNFEKQGDHRRKIEAKVIRTGSIDSKLGLFFAFIITICGIIGGIYLTTIGCEKAGISLFSTTLVAIVSAFIYGSRQRRIERENKYKIMA